LDAVKANFERRVSAHGGDDAARKSAADDIYALRWGPTRVPIYNLLLLATIIEPDKRAGILAVTRWLASDANVPVNGRDVSGTTAIHHSISTKPAFDPEFAQILLDAGGDVMIRNRYGETAVFEAGKIFESHKADVVEKATTAIKWYLTHGGSVDIKDNDGMSARGMLEDSRVVHSRRGGATVAKLYQMIEVEDRRRRVKDGRCCTFCGLEPPKDAPLLSPTNSISFLENYHRNCKVMSKQVESKDGQPIEAGDTVFTKIRGGKREGKVEHVIADEEDLKEAGGVGVRIVNPPKVVFTDQHGHKVAHNPGTLTHMEGSG
ncbi:hypothetical protein EIP91_010345, partial [Steccherinum ochraceum]